MPRPEKHVLVCTHQRPADNPKGCCSARGGGDILNEFAKEIDARNLWGRLKLNTTSCLGACEQGATALVYPEGVMYGNLKTSDVARIIDEHLIGDQPIDELKVPADVWS